MQEMNRHRLRIGCAKASGVHLPLHVGGDLCGAALWPRLVKGAADFRMFRRRADHHAHMRDMLGAAQAQHHAGRRAVKDFGDVVVVMVELEQLFGLPTPVIADERLEKGDLGIEIDVKRAFGNACDPGDVVH
ncbi:hypothetical protein CKO16_14995 [Rhodoblastus acidophilus]|nr:hypothetical protein CKO16_14995 [Rhodoblastus acidophilus]